MLITLKDVPLKPQPRHTGCGKYAKYPDGWNKYKEDMQLLIWSEARKQTADVKLNQPLILNMDFISGNQVRIELLNSTRQLPYPKKNGDLSNYLKAFEDFLQFAIGFNDKQIFHTSVNWI